MTQESLKALNVAELDKLVGERLFGDSLGWMKFYSGSGSGYVLRELQRRDWGLRFFWGASWQNLSDLWHVMIDRPDRIASHSAESKEFGVALCIAAILAEQGEEVEIGPSYERECVNGVARVKFARKREVAD